MYDDVSSPNQSSPLSPVQTWIKALTQPNVNAYREIVNDPGASIGKAALWLAVAGLIGGLFSGLVNWIFGTSFLGQFSNFGDFDIPTVGRNFFSVITGAFGGIFFALLGAFIFTAIVQVVAKMLGGTGTFDKLFYGFAASQAPISLVTGILGAIPFVGCLTFPIAIYALVLNVIANQAVHEYDTGKAVISSLTPVLIFAFFCCCAIILFGSVIGITAQSIFGNL